MSGNFAGSGSVDNRRRRRLAAHADETLPTTESSASRSAELHDLEEDPSFDPSSIGLREFIPVDIWKTAALISVLMFCAVGLIAAIHDSTLTSGHYGESLAKALDPTEGRAVSFFCIAAFISAAHLALVIGTIRARSPRDFRGRFRIWRWAAAFFFGGAMLEGTDLHLIFGDLVHQWIGATHTGWNNMFWFVPLTIAAAFVTWKLWIDMKLCRSSQAFLGLAAVAGLVLLTAEPIGRQLGFSHVVLTARVALGANLLAALLLHVRFVAHVNPNPPVAVSQADPAAASAPGTPADRANPASTRKSKSKSKNASKHRSRKQQPDVQEADDYAEFEEELPQSRRRTRTRRDGPSSESLRGLTKKQRKQARQEFREQQRARESSYRS